MYSTIEATQIILERDLNKLAAELKAFKSEQNIWVLHGQINNTAGNLALHMSGAVNHFIGAVLGNTGYVRDRPREFSDKNVLREALLGKVQDAITTVGSILPTLTEKALQNSFPEKIGGQTLSTGFFLMHLVSHINYHLGQVNYHRRLIEHNLPL
jgi:uncharacterized damage-inducible protein DinB